RHHAPPRAFRERSYLRLSRHSLGRRRHRPARLRYALARHHPARLARNGGGEDRAFARHDWRQLDHAALPALVRRREGARVARAVRNRGCTQAQAAATRAPARVSLTLLPQPPLFAPRGSSPTPATAWPACRLL